jgi:hypothetical protein
MFLYSFFLAGLKVAGVGPEIFPGSFSREFYPAGNWEFFTDVLIPSSS